MARHNPSDGTYTNRSPSRRGPKPKQIDPLDVEALAEACVTRAHLAEELGITAETLRARLEHDEQFREAYNAGVRKLRRHVAGTLLRHAEKNAIAAITLANQPHILGFQNPNQRIEGKVEHVHTISPAMVAFQNKRRDREELNAPVKDNQLVKSDETISDAVLVEPTDPKG